MRLVATTAAAQNKAILDPWSVVHFAMGLSAGLVALPFAPMLVIAVGYELAEHIFEKSEVGQALFDTQGPESVANATADVLATGLGWWLGRRWRGT